LRNSYESTASQVRPSQLPDDADRFRTQANEPREQAAKSVSALDKEAWLRIAEEWLKLAVTIEGRRE
jgi:hypothetical protein